MRFLHFTVPPKVPGPLQRPNQSIRAVWRFGVPSGDLLLFGVEFIAAAGNLCDHNLLCGFEVGIASKQRLLAASGDLCDRNLLCGFEARGASP